MEYPNSVPVHPSTYPSDLDGVCSGIPVRVSRYAELADRGALRAQMDWKHAFGSLPPGFVGVMSPQYNCIAVCWPEALPDRLEIFAYFGEAMLILDDLMDSAVDPMAVAAPFVADFLQARQMVMEGGSRIPVTPHSAAGRIIANFATDIVSIDAEKAKDVFRWLENWARLLLSQNSQKGVQNFDEYLDHRRVNIAYDVVIGLTVFVHGLSIPEDQQRTCYDLARPFWLAAALANDYYSWERERDEASAHGDIFVSNAIWVLTRQHGMTCEKAKSICRDRAREYSAEYLRVLEAVKTRDDLCNDAKVLLNLFQFSLSGNIVWSLQSGRYRHVAKNGFRDAPYEETNPTGASGVQQALTAVNITHDITRGIENGVSVVNHPKQELTAAIGADEAPKGDAHSAILNGARRDTETVNGTCGIAKNDCDSALIDKTHPGTAKMNGTHEALKENVTSLAVNGAHQKMAVVRKVPGLPREVLEAPSRYLDSLPSKGIRDIVIDVLNDWSFKLPLEEVTTIKNIINLLHGASLMLDDIHDSSQLRRGSPATHIIFGTMQTINASGYRFADALMEARKLKSERCMDVFCEEIRNLYMGQSCDISWTSTLDCPTEEEYLSMVDAKTAGLFRMLARLLDAKSDSPIKPDVGFLVHFTTLLGRLFQIRDDYMNLTSAEYTKQKGFCEDLDEGKYSLPLIHALGGCNGESISGTEAGYSVRLLRNMLSKRHVAGKMTLQEKMLFLHHLKARGSLEYTRRAMDALQDELKQLGEQMGMLENPKLRVLMETLKV
ncbi:isoprenoid synthase domain-containing protein [Chaetomium sp. MPI-SDFR-AT-0129]|nr:isoprenoid synthase domain-containing protein [Chaetomium sp. MPI-SDFR-AT-0129]